MSRQTVYGHVKMHIAETWIIKCRLKLSIIVKFQDPERFKEKSTGRTFPKLQ